MNHAVPAQSGVAREILAVGADWKLRNYGRLAQILIDIVRSFCLECRRPTLHLPQAFPNEVYGRCDPGAQTTHHTARSIMLGEWRRTAVSTFAAPKWGPCVLVHQEAE